LTILSKKSLSSEFSKAKSQREKKKRNLRGALDKEAVGKLRRYQV
jgi:hypothetical protein